MNGLGRKGASMHSTDMAGLREGDLVQHQGTGQAFVVVRGWDGQRAVATRTLDVTNPAEWELVAQAGHPGQPPSQEPPRLRRTPAERYQTDAAFHYLVASLGNLLAAADYTPSELREAVILAATIYTQRTIRPMIFGPWKG